MSHPFTRLAAAIVLIAASGTAAATVIRYNLMNLDENRWEYRYAVENSTLSEPIEEFSIYFDLGPDSSVLHADLTVTGMPAGWDGLLLRPDPRLPHAGLFDALAIGGGIDSGLALDGFAVQFTWFGVGAPTLQRYEILDPRTFGVIESGFTVEGTPPPTHIPEPSMLMLFATASGGLLLFRLRRLRRVPECRP
jgi:hypothetical protein